MKAPSLPKHQNGLALISVLFITALVVAIITAISHKQTLDIQLTGNLVFRSQAFQYTKGAEVFASEMLFRDFEQDGAGKVVDGPKDYWITYGAALPIDDGLIEVELFDLQGLFNLNNLLDDEGKLEAAQLEYLKRLFSKVETDKDVTLPQEISEAIVDWIDEDNNTTGLGSEEGDYLIKAPAYRTPNYLMSSVEELMLIEGMTPARFDELSLHVSTLPEVATLINVNLAPKEVLLALNEAISETEIDSLISQREEDDGAFKTVSDFLAHQAFAGIDPPLDANNFTVFTSYFLLKSKVTLGDRVVQAYSILLRDPENGTTRVLSRNLSKRFEPSKPLLPL